jgi:signal transduction histidine kinase
MAHEIRNPLASLKGNAQILAERLPAEGRERRKAQRIVREAKRLESLCQALLDFCRTQPLERREVDPTALVREVADSLENSHVELDAATAPERWSLDPLRMRQVLLNLLGNARQASPEGEPVEVRVARANGRLVIAGRDRGEGIPAQHIPRLTERFYRVDAGRSREKGGTGLGLAIVKHIVNRHRGRLLIVSEPGEGSTFTVCLPAELSPAAAG